jgi:hypothetical protein
MMSVKAGQAQSIAADVPLCESDDIHRHGIAPAYDLSLRGLRHAQANLGC